MMVIMYSKQTLSLPGADNYCSVYDVRPSDCERFPLTAEDAVILNSHNRLLWKNSSFVRLLFVMEKLDGENQLKSKREEL